MKNICICIQNHHANFNAFPPGYGPVGESYLVNIMPFIERAQFYNSLNLKNPPANMVVCSENGTAFTYQINSFLCPSDRARSDAVSNASANYAANAGLNVLTGDGVFIGRPLSSNDISDGLSQTVALSEWVIGSGLENHGTRLGSVYKLNNSIIDYDSFFLMLAMV